MAIILEIHGVTIPESAMLLLKYGKNVKNERMTDPVKENAIKQTNTNTIKNTIINFFISFSF